MKEKNIYSEHIFFFPFTWEIHKKKYCDQSFTSRTNIEYIKKVFSNDWEMQLFQTNQPVHYNEYIYFFPPVRNALYNRKAHNEVMYNFKYRKTQLGVSQYIIDLKDIRYTLQIEDIKLRIYKTGIGILSFHLHNDAYEDPEQILQINNFGRRVYPPYLPLNQVKNHLLAEQLTLFINEDLVITEDFEKPYHEYPVQISNTIMSLLGNKFKTIPDHLKPGDLYIQPVIDDRMFVMCWYTNPDIAKQLCTQNNTKKYGYQDHVFWYRYLFVDGTGVSCKNPHMLSDLIEGHTYDRWADDHILYGITRYSFMSIGAQKAATYKVYDQLVCLALVQRASALHFSNEASRIATLSKVKLVVGIRSLYEYHILFINHLYFREVTADNQGIELYESLMDQMKILSDINMLDAEIEEINEYATLIAQEASQKRTNAITVIGAALIIPTLVTGFFGMNIFKDLLSTWWKHPSIHKWLNAYFLLPVFIVILLSMLRPQRSFRYIAFIIFIGILALISFYIAYTFGCGL